MTVKSTVINLGDTDIRPYKETAFNTSDFIPFGSDNLFPQACALLARSSPNHRGVINSRQNYIIGNGIDTEEKATEYLLTRADFEKEKGYTVLKEPKNGTPLFLHDLDPKRGRLSDEPKIECGIFCEMVENDYNSKGRIL